MKQFTFLFSTQSLKDIEDARDYYDSIETAVRKKFMMQLQQCLYAIKRNPYFAGIRYEDIRCAQIKKFPYLVHYHIDEKNSLVRILAVYSTYREPRSK